MNIDFDFYQGNIDRFMDIARKHLDYIGKIKRGELKLPGIIGDHGVVVSVFSAASIEATINLYILIPIVFIKDNQIRLFYGNLLAKYFRSSIPSKLHFVSETFPELKKKKNLLKKIEKIFSYRNRIMHSALEYGETNESEYYFNQNEPKTKVSKNTVPEFRFDSDINSEKDIKLAHEHFRIAKEFIETMKPFQTRKITKKEVHMFDHLIQQSVR